MGIKSIAIFDFIELCSKAFLLTVNDCMSKKVKRLNVSSKKFKALLYYYICIDLSKHHNNGLNVVIINSCKLMNHWNYQQIDPIYTNTIVDTTLNVTDRSISDSLDCIWSLLCRKTPYNTIRNKVLSSKEVKEITIREIGISHIITTEEKFDYITDNNNLFQGSSSIPHYLEEEVIQVLRNYKLLL